MNMASNVGSDDERTTMRVLIAARLSQGNGEEASRIERDDLAARAWAEREGHEVVATSEDYVSGKSDPFERASLSPWLTDPALIAQWDVVVASKLDRLSRSVRHLHALQEWCVDHGKRIVVIDQGLEWPVPAGSAGFASGLLWSVFGQLAQWELDTITERYGAARETVRANGGYIGRPPFGWEMDNGDKYQKQLVIVPSLVPVLHDMVARALRGDTLLSIARWLDIASPKDGARWSPTSVRQMLQNPALKGRQYDKSGRVSYRHEGVLSAAEWDQLQVAMQRGSGRRNRNNADTAMLTGSLACGLCGGPMYRFRSTVKRADGSRNVNVYYRCKGIDQAPSTCRNMAPADAVEEWVHRCMTGDALGRHEIVELVTVAGDGHEAEAAELAAEMRDLDPDDPDGSTKYGTLAAERKRLLELPSTPPTVQEVPTGRTLADAWTAMSPLDRRRYLLAADVGIHVAPLEAGTPGAAPLPHHAAWLTGDPAALSGAMAGFLADEGVAS